MRDNLTGKLEGERMHGDPNRHAHVDDPQRAGAKQPERFDSKKADRLDDPSRFEYLPPEKIVALLELPRGGTLVDFGTGTGTFAIRVAQARPDVTVVGLDEQPEMLERLRAKPAAKSLENLRPVPPDQIPALRGRADRVLALNVLHELGDDALAALGSLLGAEGFVIFIDWNAEVERPVGPPRDHVYGPREAAERLERHGYAAEILDPMPYHYVLRARLSSKR
jgi:SAM-dependent methyltransferase